MLLFVSPATASDSGFSMNPHLCGAVICSLTLLILLLIRKNSKKNQTKLLFGIILASLASLIFTALYLVHLHRKEHIHIDHASALIQAEAQVVNDEIFARHGRAKIAVIHRPGEQNTGITAELLRRLEEQGHEVLRLEPASMKEGRDNTYFKGRALERCLKVEADIFISTCGLPPLDELIELSRFHPEEDEKGDATEENPLPLKPLYVLNGHSAKYLPYLKNGAISGLVIWKVKPDVEVFGFRGLSPRDIFERRYNFVRNDKLADLPASEMAAFEAPKP